MMKYFYTYKIQFVDGYYYYGSRQSKVDPKSDIYWGSPKTHKEKWNTTHYEKTILNVFECGEEMLREETELIGDKYKTDEFCLNQHNNDNFSTLGMVYSEESREKMRRAKDGFVPWNKGKKCHTLEQKQKWSDARRGKIHSSKLSADDVGEIRRMFSEKPPLPNVGQVQGNGRVLTYERAFSNTFHTLFQITQPNLYNIITGRSWTNV